MGRRVYRTKKKRPSKTVNIYSTIMNTIILLMLLGAVLGAIFSNIVDDASYNSVKTFLTGFLVNFDKNEINQKVAFLGSFYKYFRVSFLVWFLGFFSSGFVGIALIMFFKAFAYGFTTAALVKYFGVYGLVVGFNSYVPQNLFFLPALFFTARSAILYVHTKKQNGTKNNSGYLDGNTYEYFIVFAISLICCIIAALIETYLTPALLEYIKPY